MKPEMQLNEDDIRTLMGFFVLGKGSRITYGAEGMVKRPSARLEASLEHLLQLGLISLKYNGAQGIELRGTVFDHQLVISRMQQLGMDKLAFFEKRDPGLAFVTPEDYESEVKSELTTISGPGM